jgi:hypothetical protein
MGTGVGAVVLGGVGTGTEVGAWVGIGICPGMVGIGIGVVLFMTMAGGALACAAELAVGVGLFAVGGIGGYTFVSFFRGGLPAAPDTSAGRGEFFGSFLTVVLGLGAGATSGEPVRSKLGPMLGNGATGLMSCLTGRVGGWKGVAAACDDIPPTAGEALTMVGDPSDSRSICIGAGGATACCSC